MISLYISEHNAFVLDFNTDNIGRFSRCRLQLVRDSIAENIYEDYLYIFINEILGSLRNLPVLDNGNMFGKVGKWQEYFYFDREYNKKHSKEIKTMEEATLFSTEGYGAFLYKWDDKIWLEFNKSYYDHDLLCPLEYYANPKNYRVFLVCLSADQVLSWQRKLEDMDAKLYSPQPLNYEQRAQQEV